MKALVLNSGSSSIKYQLFRCDDWESLASGAITRIGEQEGALARRWLNAQGEAESSKETLTVADHHAGLECIVSGLRKTGALGDVTQRRAVGHRVVHGGEAFHCPTIVDDPVVAAIRDTIPLAPLHYPANLDGIVVARQSLEAVA
ncbi:MAG: hypothetical protein P8Y25_07140 [Chromatiaceae bacterium]